MLISVLFCHMVVEPRMVYLVLLAKLSYICDLLDNYHRESSK